MAHKDVEDFRRDVHLCMACKGTGIQKKGIWGTPHICEACLGAGETIETFQERIL